MMRFFGPDAVWDMGPMGMGNFEGAAAVRRFVEDWQGSYEEYEAEVEDIVHFGDNVTLAVSVQKGRPVGSAGDVRIRFAAVYSWAEGMIARATTYLDVDEARAAAERLAQERG
jgi:ketosteroid isomerase-like protein